MYTITGVFATTWAPTGQVLRTQKMFKQIVLTEHGVLNFIDDHKPFSEIKVVDALGKDVTEEFVNLKEVKK